MALSEEKYRALCESHSNTTQAAHKAFDELRCAYYEIVYELDRVTISLSETISRQAARIKELEEEAGVKRS